MEENQEETQPETQEVQEETTENVETTETQEAPASEDEALEQELDQDEERLPFPNARVVRIMKGELDKEKMIRARVKKDMNEFLGEICKRVSRELNKSPYTVIEGGDLHRAIKKYEQFEEISKQKERLVLSLNKIKQDCDFLIGEVERSFEIEKK